MCDKLIELYQRFPRLTYKEIANTMNLEIEEVYYLITQLQKTGIVPFRNNTGSPLALTERQLNKIKQIAHLRQQGHTYQSIATSLKISKQAVQQYIDYHFPELVDQRQNNIDARRIKEQHLIKLYNQFPRLTLDMMSDQLDIPRSRIGSMIGSLVRRKLIVSRYTGSRASTQAQLDRASYIIDLRNQGFTWQQVSDEMGIRVRSVIDFVKRHNPDYFKQSSSLLTHDTKT